MSTGDDDWQGRGAWFSTKWAGIVAVFVGVMAVVVAAAVAAGIPVVNSPMAAADDGVTAQPWMPKPAFGPQPVPQPHSSVNAQQQKPSTAPGAKGAGWVAKAAPSFQAIHQAMVSLGNALQNSDVNAMQTACRQLSSAGAQFGATLPSPQQAMTDEAQAAVNEINAASSACLADPPDAVAAASHATEANNHLTAVGKMAQGG
jgi:hypothetical protein